jgi:hypothetical protein
VQMHQVLVGATEHSSKCKYNQVLDCSTLATQTSGAVIAMLSVILCNARVCCAQAR